MPYSVSIDDSTPSPRYNTAQPWTHVAWEQAAARSGPWTRIDTQALSPLDTDPENPATRDLTTSAVTLYPGWLRLVWVDAAAVEEPTEPVFVGSAIRPAVLEVANLMPDRTTLPHSVDGENDEAGTFTGDTRPTAMQVDALIDLVLDTVDVNVPQDAPGEVQRAARSIVALNAAILTELTYFSHQGEVNTTRIEAWERLIERHQATLDAAVNDNQPGRPRYGSIPLTTVLTGTDSCGDLGLLP